MCFFCSLRAPTSSLRIANASFRSLSRWRFRSATAATGLCLRITSAFLQRAPFFRLLSIVPALGDRFALTAAAGLGSRPTSAFLQAREGCRITVARGNDGGRAGKLAEEWREATVEIVHLVARASMLKELYIEHEATPQEAAAVKEAFARAGFPVTIKRGLEWGGEGEEPWGVVFSATVPLPVFFAAFATEGTNDPYAAVKAWAQEIFEARRGAGWKRG